MASDPDRGVRDDPWPGEYASEEVSLQGRISGKSVGQGRDRRRPDYAPRRQELLGQVDEPSPKGTLRVLARRDWVRANLPGRAEEWEATEKTAIAAAVRQRRERLAAWRRDRPAQPAPGDRITAWLDGALSGPPGPGTPSPLIAVRLGRGDVTAVKRRGGPVARALRCAWLLGLPDPETTPLATLTDAIAGRGMILQGDEPVAIDRLLPPSVELEDRLAPPPRGDRG